MIPKIVGIACLTLYLHESIPWSIIANTRQALFQIGCRQLVRLQSRRFASVCPCQWYVITRKYRLILAEDEHGMRTPSGFWYVAKEGVPRPSLDKLRTNVALSSHMGLFLTRPPSTCSWYVSRVTTALLITIN